MNWKLKNLKIRRQLQVVIYHFRLDQTTHALRITFRRQKIPLPLSDARPLIKSTLRKAASRATCVVYMQTVKGSAETRRHATHPRCWGLLKRLGRRWRGVAAFCSGRHLGMRWPSARSGPPQGPGSRRRRHLHPLENPTNDVFGLKKLDQISQVCVPHDLTANNLKLYLTNNRVKFSPTINSQFWQDRTGVLYVVTWNSKRYSSHSINNDFYNMIQGHCCKCDKNVAGMDRSIKCSSFTLKHKEHLIKRFGLSCS